MAVDVPAGSAEGSQLDRLPAAMRNRSATVAVVGLGQVGLPLLVAVAEEGFPVIGVDRDRARVDLLRTGRSYLRDVSDADLARLVGAGARSPFTSDREALASADVVVIDVPTAIRNGEPDLSALLDASASLSWSLRPGALVIVESTVYPGATQELVLPALQRSGLRAGRDFELAYSPERVDPGSRWSIREIPKLTAGLTPRAADLAAQFYAELGVPTVGTPSVRVAEMAKLVENVFRQVNVSLANELAKVAETVGVDVWDVVDAAATKPFGYMAFRPGAGAGGMCLGTASRYLAWLAAWAGAATPLIDRALEVDAAMPGYVAARVLALLQGVEDPHVLCVGVSYKAGVGEVRGSAARSVIEHLLAAGVRCSYHDPLVPTLTLAGTRRISVSLDPTNVADKDCVCILTAHPGVDYQALLSAARSVFDATGVTRGIPGGNVVRL